ncbi:MAG TPA: nucleotide exchange factor GrpE [Longimicrobium sp.]|jgi:molecular chaperone GrpE|nr:nucleotide exchange factor GrpE [Longimicrobium sp.]
MTHPSLALDVRAEIARLVPIGLEAPEEDAGAPLVERWEDVSRTLARLGKQQLRSNQSLDFLESQLAEAKERADEHRREAARLREESRRNAQALLDLVDTLDDLAVFARQLRDERWITHAERMLAKTLRVLGQLGLAEIPALGEAFDPAEHEAAQSVERSGEQRPYEIVEVIQRGFRYNGQVLRRAQVITTR